MSFEPALQAAEKLGFRSVYVRARLQYLREDSTWQIAEEREASKLAVTQPRSRRDDVSPGRKPRVK